MIVRTTLAALAATFTLTAVASADVYDHIDRLALQLQLQARDLYGEVAHYRHTSEYGHLRSDASRMFYLAKHVHEVAHRHGNVAHLERDVRELDRLFHHTQGLIYRIEHNAQYHGDGHVHGHTGHVKGLLAKMEGTLHHLQADLRELRSHWQPGHGHGGHGHGGHGHGHGAHGHGAHGGGVGVSFGNGSFRIRFGR